MELRKGRVVERVKDRGGKENRKTKERWKTGAKMMING